MEENTARTNETEEIEVVDEVTETSESSNAGAFVAGIAGGVLAYALVSGAKRLAALIAAKVDAKKQKRAAAPIVEAEIIEPDKPKQAESNAKTPNN